MRDVVTPDSHDAEIPTRGTHGLAGSDDMPFVQVVLANRSFLDRVFRFHVFQFTSSSGRWSAAASSSRAAHFEQPRVWKLFKLRPGATIRLGGSWESNLGSLCRALE